jgi:hypothetical protein
MKNIYTTKLGAFAFFCFLALLSHNGFSQVGINNTNPDADAILDITSTAGNPGGLLLPRVALTGTGSPAPLSADVAGMVVYNTATAGTAPNNVTPGYYYNDGTSWERVAVDSPNNDWSRVGNAGTTAGTNFLGTTDNVSLRIRTNGSDRFDYTTNGRLRSFNSGNAGQPTYSWNNDTDIGMYRVGANILGFSALQASINGGPLFTGDRFTVNGATDEYAINGYATGTAGVAVYGENNTSGGTGIIGAATGGQGTVGLNVSGAGDGVFGNSSNVGVRGYGAHGAILESGLDGGYGAIAWNTTAAGTNRTGLLAIGQDLGPISFPSTGAILYGDSGAIGFGDNTAGTGLIGVGNGGLTAYTVGSGVSGTGSTVGVYGYADETGVNNPDGTFSAAGGYFANNYSGFAAVAVWADPADGTDNDQNFKIVGTGNVSTIVKDVNETPVIMYAPEAPESLFQDYGVGELTNGTARIQLDPTLTKNIRVDANHPIKVFVQLEGDCNGVYVTDKSANGFTVKELQNGRSNVNFSWSIVATRADEVFYNEKGETRVSHNNLRFPKAPKSLETIKISRKNVKAGLPEAQIQKAKPIKAKRKLRAKAQTSSLTKDKRQEVSKNIEKIQSVAPSKN